MIDKGIYKKLEVKNISRGENGRFPSIKEKYSDKKSYVYYLLNEGSCIYIGFSQNIDDRLIAHDVDKVFDSVTIVPFNDKLNALYFESAEIMRVQPKHNRDSIKGWQTVENVLKTVNSRYINVSSEDVVQCARELGLNVARYKNRIMIEGSTVKLRNYMRKVK